MLSRDDKLPLFFTWDFSHFAHMLPQSGRAVLAHSFGSYTASIVSDTLIELNQYVTLQRSTHALD